MPIELLAGRGAGPLISAHRGFSVRAPENTLPALEAAFEAGADLAEPAWEIGCMAPRHEPPCHPQRSELQRRSRRLATSSMAIDPTTNRVPSAFTVGRMPISTCAQMYIGNVP